MKFSLQIFSTLVLSFLLVDQVRSDKILVISFFGSKSHKLTYMPLIEELGKRGHNVTMITQVKPSKELMNVKQIVTMEWEDIEKRMQFTSIFEAKEKGESLNPFIMGDLFADLCRSTYDLPIIKEILKENFDLVFMQPLFNDCALGMVHRLKAPLVLFSPVGVAGFLVEKVGGHLPPSFIPNLFLGYTSEMSFFERLSNFAFTVMLEGILRFYFEPQMTAVYREKLGEDIPPVHEILGTTSLILSNGHFSLHQPKSLLPDIVEVGGLHSFVSAKPLPKDIEDFIQKGKDGFIFFSMGSAIKGSTMPEEKRQMFLRVFSKLKQQVLWKWETETMPELPKNVKLSKWLPQQDLLAHKDIKMFITHCGGGSTEEAIYNGVPLVGFPMFGDQLANSKLARTHGFIEEMSWNDVTEEKLTAAIQNVLNDPKFRENAKKISTLYRDQPDNPLSRAVYWVEYILRHKGAPHLRSAGRKLNWFQYHSYDVILTYCGLIVGTLYLIFATLRWTIRKICGSSPRKSGKPKRD